MLSFLLQIIHDIIAFYILIAQKINKTIRLFVSLITGTVQEIIS